MDTQPFDSIPTGEEIAQHFYSECAGKRQDARGFDLYRDGSDYCYLWVQGHFDFDLSESWLIEVRTYLNGSEVRDMMIVTAKYGKFQWEWQGGPSNNTDSSFDEYQDYMTKALTWFANRTISEFVDD